MSGGPEAIDRVWTRASLSFASCYVYAPHGTGVVCMGSRLLCQRVKACDPLWMPRYAGSVADLVLRDRQYTRLFVPGLVMVPVPRSAPSGPQSWPAWQLATALRSLGLGGAVWAGLQRRLPVRRSATAPVGRRPTVHEHYESFAVSRDLRPTPERIVLVDDVITRGRTLFAAALRLREALPNADIRGFALVRAQGFVTRLDRVLAPCEGFLWWARGDVLRDP